jgi:Glu-tRNA(Gln) amidotransferase subunit E-like FAD-binding protein
MGSDYEKLGLKCGLEVHQQLDTKKLFCNCLSLITQKDPDFSVKRRLHIVAGESGEIDEAAVFHDSLKREHTYQGYDTTCLVELDESPPREINIGALKITLQVALLLNAKVLPLTQIMRKTVIDGSNTSGFQRTVLIAIDGFLETNHGRVGIESICLEEDSARIILQDNKEAVYRLDRLGIPLIEIATAPDIKTPEQAKEVALHIGNILRSCNVKRGIGTIRQDVNVSIKNGNRVEIKGVQKPELIEKAVKEEAKRQFELIKNKKKVEEEVRRVLPDGKTEFLRPLPGSARMYPETDLPLLKISRNFINEVKKTLPKLKHETEKELKKIGLSQEMIKLLSKTNKIQELTELVKIINDPKLISDMLLTYPKEIAGHGKMSLTKIDNLLTKDILALILEKVKNKELPKNQVRISMERFLETNDLNDSLKFKREDISNVEGKILRIIKEKPGLSEKAYMGLVMKEFKGKIHGKEAMEIIKKHV